MGKMFLRNPKATMPENPFKLVKTIIADSLCPWLTLMVDGFTLIEKSGPDAAGTGSRRLAEPWPVEVWDG